MWASARGVAVGVPVPKRAGRGALKSTALERKQPVQQHTTDHAPFATPASTQKLTYAQVVLALDLGPSEMALHYGGKKEAMRRPSVCVCVA